MINQEFYYKLFKIYESIIKIIFIYFFANEINWGTSLTWMVIWAKYNTTAAHMCLDSNAKTREVEKHKINLKIRAAFWTVFGQFRFRAVSFSFQLILTWFLSDFLSHSLHSLPSGAAAQVYEINHDITKQKTQLAVIELTGTLRKIGQRRESREQ